MQIFYASGFEEENRIIEFASRHIYRREGDYDTPAYKTRQFKAGLQWISVNRERFLISTTHVRIKAARR